MNITVDERDIRFPKKINLYRKTRELIYNDLTKTSLEARKIEALLWKVINQWKLEKENSRALYTQNEELNKLIVKLGVNPAEISTMQNLL